MQVTNFDYFRDEQDNFFIALGDKHLEETVAALPVYVPDPDGDRVYQGTRLSKASTEQYTDLEEVSYEESGIRFATVEVPRDRIVETVSPYRDRDEVLSNMDTDRHEMYEAIDAATDDNELMVIGSDTFDVGTDSSDLDLVWLDAYDRFEEYHDELVEELGLQEVGEDWLEDRFESHAERYQVPETVAAYHYTHPQQRFRAGDGLKIGFNPSHEPGAFDDYLRPEPGEEGEEVSLTAMVADTEHNDSWPRMVELETEEYGDLDLLTFFWAYGGSFEEGDELVVEGELFEEEETVLIRDRGQYAVPRDEL